MISESAGVSAEAAAAASDLGVVRGAAAARSRSATRAQSPAASAPVALEPELALAGSKPVHDRRTTSAARRLSAQRGINSAEMLTRRSGRPERAEGSGPDGRADLERGSGATSGRSRSAPGDREHRGVRAAAADEVTVLGKPDALRRAREKRKRGN